MTVTGASAIATTPYSAVAPVPTTMSLRIEFIRSLLVRPVRQGLQGVLTQPGPEVGSPRASTGRVILTAGAVAPSGPPVPEAAAARRCSGPGLRRARPTRSTGSCGLAASHRAADRG